MTDVPDVVGVWVNSAVGNSDLSAIFIVVALQQPIPHLCVGGRSISRNLWTGSWLEGM